ncbi:hypothetical protein JW756_01515 [Candidatus Woesearchaeota archaeon]|nr:hypothetical protein [Candidatus Woesearchaeota archaeon]
MAQIKRETATICKVNDLLQGSFVKTEGWEPSYFETDLGEISRVNVVGVVINKDSTGSILLDDGSGRILLRSFEGDKFTTVDTGDLVMIIGRPRVYNEQKYVLPEIIKKIDPKWGEYRQIQLQILRKKIIPVKREARITIEEDTPINYFQKIMNYIKDLDTGSGADVEEVIKRSESPKAEELIRKLIEEGELFELKPGKLKVLE